MRATFISLDLLGTVRRLPRCAMEAFQGGRTLLPLWAESLPVERSLRPWGSLREPTGMAVAGFAGAGGAIARAHKCR